MANTIIGPGIVVDGEITGDDPLVVEGQVKGRVAVAQSLTVAEGATVEANLEGSTVTIAGDFTGNVVAGERVEVKSGGKVLGDVRAPRVAIADGATFKGNVDMDA